MVGLLTSSSLVFNMNAIQQLLSVITALCHRPLHLDCLLQCHLHHLCPTYLWRRQHQFQSHCRCGTMLCWHHRFHHRYPELSPRLNPQLSNNPCHRQSTARAAAQCFWSKIKLNQRRMTKWAIMVSDSRSGSATLTDSFSLELGLKLPDPKSISRFYRGRSHPRNLNRT